MAPSPKGARMTDSGGPPPSPDDSPAADAQELTGLEPSPGIMPPPSSIPPGTPPPGTVAPAPGPPAPSLRPPPPSGAAPRRPPHLAGHETIQPAAGQPVTRDRRRLTGPIRPPAMLLFLLAGAGIAILAASYYYFRSAPRAPASATQPTAVAPATRPAASAPSGHNRASAPATRTEQWVRGLRALRTDMYAAMGSGAPTTVTAASLRSAARKFSRCTAELAALGPPPGQLRQVYGQARQAC